jgi:YVTN family beta-propeller protein
MIKMKRSTTRFPFLFAPLALTVFCYVPLTGSAQQAVRDSLITTDALPKNQVVATIPLGQEPSELVVSPDSKCVYAANTVFPGENGIVQVIDTTSNTVTATINVASNVLLNKIAITPDGSTLYVTEFEGNNLWVINTATQQVTNPVTFTIFPNGIAISPDGTQLYACLEDGTLQIIDTATNKITSSIVIGKTPSHYPWSAVFTPDGSKAYIAGRPNHHPTGPNHGWIAVFDTATQKVTGSILLTTGIPLGTMAMAPNGLDFFYSDRTSIPVISTSSNKVVRTMSLNVSQLGAAITPNGKFLYMCAATGNTLNEVAMVDVASGKPVGKQISLKVPDGLAMAPNGNFAYVFFEMPSQWGLAVIDISPL